MGLLDNLERGLEKAVQSAFTAGGSRAVKPVEIANALRLAMDDEAVVLSEGRTFAPNVFTLRFATDDFALARKWGTTLAEELCDEAIGHARDQGYTLHGPVRVTFIEDDSLRAGKVAVDTESDRTGGEPQTPDAGPAPSSTGSAAAVGRAPVDGSAAAPPRPTRPTRPPSGPLQPVLEIDGQRYGLNADSIVLGRSADADIHVEDTGVSRRHLEIITRGSTVMAVDLGSTNGFHVNDRRVEGSTVLKDGDRITMGRVLLVFRMLPGRGAQNGQNQGGTP